MKYLAAVPLAAALLFSAVSGAQAFRLPSDYRAHQAQMQPSAYDKADVDVYHRCHGQASGTAHRSCGTRTGGPSGGLF